MRIHSPVWGYIVRESERKLIPQIEPRNRRAELLKELEHLERESRRLIQEHDRVTERYRSVQRELEKLRALRVN